MGRPKPGADPSQVRIFVGAALIGGPAGAGSQNAVAVAGGRVLATGEAKALQARFPGATARDLRPLRLAPAFCDHHLHLGEMVRARAAVDLSACRNEDQLSDAIGAARREVPQATGDWLVGRDLNLLTFSGFSAKPREVLAGIAPHRPLVIRSTDLHSAFANPAALAATGLADHPTGHLREKEAFALIDALPLPGGTAWKKALDQVAADLHRAGIVRVTDMSGLSVHERMWRMKEGDQPALRVDTSVLADELTDGRPPAGGWRAARGRVRLAWVKAFLDGSLGSSTAWLLPPAPSDGGPLCSDEDLSAIVRASRVAGLPLAVHAIGDGAVRQASRLLGAGDRIEHGQHARPDDLVRLARRGIAVCANPQHMALDWRQARQALPAGGAGSYPLASMARSGVRICFGSDAPVVTPAPTEAVRWAVERCDPQGQPAGGWLPQERLAEGEALAACWSGPEPLARGRPADLLAMSGSSLEGPGPKWGGFRLEGLWLAGQRVQISLLSSAADRSPGPRERP